MSPNYRSLVIRYQPYLQEFLDLIADRSEKSTINPEVFENIRRFLAAADDPGDDFEISFKISTENDHVKIVYLAAFYPGEFEVKSFAIADEDEQEEWHFHYLDSLQEYEGNLFADGDWDLFLEEVAELDDDQNLQIEVVYEV